MPFRRVVPLRFGTPAASWYLLRRHMHCPECGHPESRVVDSRESGAEVRRRRQCLACGQRFTTYERVEPPRLLIAKRNGRVEDFDPAKLRATLARLRSKRLVSDEELGGLVGRIERGLCDEVNGAVPAERLAARVLDELERFDPVMAWRFGAGYERGADGGLRKRAVPEGPPAAPAVAVREQLSLLFAVPEPLPGSPRPRPRGRRQGSR